MINRPGSLLLLSAVTALLASPRAAPALDKENCLSCHRYAGLGRIADDGTTVELYNVDPNYYDRALGPHARLRCTDCHPREEVAVIPHQPVSAVNCTTACHLAPEGRMEILFSHQAVAGMLQGSAHSPKVLSDSNTLLGEPLKPDQSQCLLCHQEPVFRRDIQGLTSFDEPVQRCNTCHGDELPVQIGTEFAFRHVFARSRPARSKESTVRLCARCHSNESILASFSMPDTTASYLASFHGKAVQLGSDTTADCLDCHVGELQNVHMIHGRDHPESSVSEARLPDTCRSAACHPTAGHAVTTAAVHLNISSSRGVEYFIAAMFILLILATFGPSIVLQSLEMLQFVVGRHDHRQHHLHELADRIKKDPRGRKALTRFTPHQRVQHWILAISFTVLVVTGFPIKFADRDWARWLVDLAGGLHRMRLMHRYAGVLLMVGFAYHFAYVFASALRDRRRHNKSWLRTILDLPMMTNPKDLRQLFQMLAYLFFLRKTRPDLGRFSLKEKFEYFGVFWGSCLLGVTGILMWANAWTSSLFTGRVLTIALLIHTFEAFLALLHVGVIHMIGVILSPVVFPLSHAMTSGDTPSEELAEAHAGMVTEVARELGLDAQGGASHV